MPLHLKISDLATRPYVQRSHLGEDTSCTIPTARSKEDGTAELSYPQSPKLTSQGTRHLHCPSINKEGYALSSRGKEHGDSR